MGTFVGIIHLQGSPCRCRTASDERIHPTNLVVSCPLTLADLSERIWHLVCGQGSPETHDRFAGKGTLGKKAANRQVPPHVPRYLVFSSSPVSMLLPLAAVSLSPTICACSPRVNAELTLMSPETAQFCRSRIGFSSPK